MSWYDDFSTRIGQIGTKVTDNVESYIVNKASEAVVKITGGEKGNLNAQQIADGQRGGNVQSALPVLATSNFTQYLPYVAAGLAALLIFKRGRK